MHRSELSRVLDDVSVIVPVRNEGASLGSFLDSLIAQDARPREIVICDAGSTDASARIVGERLGPNGRVVTSGPAYPGRARNLAIADATSTWIAMTDAGTVVNRSWLRELGAAASEHPEIDVVFGSYEPILTSRFEKCLALSFVAPLRGSDGVRFRGPTTASLLIRKRVWQELGGFSEDLRACEDLLFFESLAARGYRTVCAAAASVKWRMPSTMGQTFRRFRSYSFHTLKAGRGRTWHSAIVKMYAAAAVAVASAWFVHWSLAALPALGMLLRVRRSVLARPDIVEAGGSVDALDYAAIAGLLIWIDAAAIAGAVQYGLAKVKSDAGRPT